MDVYIYKGDIYCRSCGEAIIRRREAETGTPAGIMANLDNREDSDAWPQGPFPNGGGEADTPQHCGNCKEFLQNPLTDDGRDYVKRAMETYANETWSFHDSFGQTCGSESVLEEWSDFYDIGPAPAEYSPDQGELI